MDLPIRSTWHPSERRRIALDAPPDKRLAAFLLPRCARPGNQRRLAYWGRAFRPAMHGLRNPCLRARKGIAMSRYTGPRLRKVRRLGVALPGLVQKDTVRMYPPGIHGQGRRPRKPSDYALRLKETQKLRFHYGGFGNVSCATSSGARCARSKPVMPSFLRCLRAVWTTCCFAQGLRRPTEPLARS